VVTAEGETMEQTRSTSMPFTEDLFYWDNDLANDRAGVSQQDSRFFAGWASWKWTTASEPLLARYVDYDFKIDTAEWEVSFRVRWNRRRLTRVEESRSLVVKRYLHLVLLHWRSCNSFSMVPRRTSGEVHLQSTTDFVARRKQRSDGRASPGADVKDSPERLRWLCRRTTCCSSMSFATR